MQAPQNLIQPEHDNQPAIRILGSTTGVHRFYVRSETQPSVEYLVQHVRRAGQRRWFCDCADFKFRRLARKRHCKHARILAALAKQAHGVSRLVGGAS